MRQDTAQALDFIAFTGIYNLLVTENPQWLSHKTKKPSGYGKLFIGLTTKPAACAA
jgi:hypothetical protein